MIAPWLLELLSREWNWRAALRRIAGELAARSPSTPAACSREDARACADVARALEHVEPDRRFAIASYRQAGPEHDDGRGLALAIELGWWPMVGALAKCERTSSGSLEAIVWEARALIDTDERVKADKLLPTRPSDERLAALRAELVGGSPAVFEQWLTRARAQSGPQASEAFLIAARQARALGRDDWAEPLRQAALADPEHSGVEAMLIDRYLGEGRGDSRGLLEHLRQRLGLFEARGDLTAWCDATRLAVMRMWFGAGGERHRGLARRLLAAALERAYREGVTEISGHLAMWAVLDEAATADQTRTELLGLLVSALEGELPRSDRIWLAALGAEICASVANLQAAHAYAAVVVELAPLHPVVRDYFAGTVAAPMPPQESQLQAFRDALLQLDVEPWQELQIEQMSPLSSDDIELAPGGAAPERGSVAIEGAPGSAVPVIEGEVVMESDGVVGDGNGSGHGYGYADGSSHRFGTGIGAGRVGKVAETVESRPIPSPSADVPTAPASSMGARASERLDDAWSLEPEAPARSRRGNPGSGPGTAPIPDAIPVGSRRPPTGTVAAVSIRKAAIARPAGIAGSASAGAPSAAAAAAARPGSIIPSIVRSAMAGGGKPKPLPPRPEPPSALPRARRVTVSMDLRLFVGGRELVMQSRDVSSSGLFAVTAEKLPLGEILECELRVPSSGISEEPHRARVRVVRRSKIGYGCELVSPSPQLAAALARLTSPEPPP